MAWMSKWLSMFYVDAITYSYRSPDDGLASPC